MLRNGDEPVPGYVLKRLLGRGGFGEVWHAQGPGRVDLALKFINLSGAGGLKEFRAVERVKLVRHVNLLPIHALWLLDDEGRVLDDDAVCALEACIERSSANDCAESHAAKPSAKNPKVVGTGPIEPDEAQRRRPSLLIIAMQKADKSLLDRLEECQAEGLPGIPPAELLGYMEEAAKGIDFLNSARHDLGAGKSAIQHCDIKPQNLMLIGTSATVCDFGLARVLGDSRASSQMGGSPAYMAPESIEGRRPSAATDQYSLGITYFELRTGKLPFKDPSYGAVLHSHLSGKLDLSALEREDERRVIARATSTAPEDRYKSTSAMVMALYRALLPLGVCSLAEDDDEPAGDPNVGRREIAISEEGAAALARSSARGNIAVAATIEDDSSLIERERQTADALRDTTQHDTEPSVATPASAVSPAVVPPPAPAATISTGANATLKSAPQVASAPQSLAAPTMPSASASSAWWKLVVGGCVLVLGFVAIRPLLQSRDDGEQSVAVLTPKQGTPEKPDAAKPDPEKPNAAMQHVPAEAVPPPPGPLVARGGHDKSSDSVLLHQPPEPGSRAVKAVAGSATRDQKTVRLHFEPADAAVTINGSSRELNRDGELLLSIGPGETVEIFAERAGHATLSGKFTLGKLQESNFRMVLPARTRIVPNPAAPNSKAPNREVDPPSPPTTKEAEDPFGPPPADPFEGPPNAKLPGGDVPTP